MDIALASDVGAAVAGGLIRSMGHHVALLAFAYDEAAGEVGVEPLPNRALVSVALKRHAGLATIVVEGVAETYLVEVAANLLAAGGLRGAVGGSLGATSSPGHPEVLRENGTTSDASRIVRLEMPREAAGPLLLHTTWDNHPDLGTGLDQADLAGNDGRLGASLSRSAGTLAGKGFVDSSYW